MAESKLILKQNPTLADCQAYVAIMVHERGFEKETMPEIMMLLLEECGELAKALRKAQKSTPIKIQNNSASTMKLPMFLCIFWISAITAA